MEDKIYGFGRFLGWFRSEGFFGENQTKLDVLKLEFDFKIVLEDYEILNGKFGQFWAQIER